MAFSSFLMEIQLLFDVVNFNCNFKLSLCDHFHQDLTGQKHNEKVDSNLFCCHILNKRRLEANKHCETLVHINKL
ncbi:hypothetical protein BpHYR1_052875 [Brachionus plicatilis]|uniref:Uncharacterized protein n=1 Tax=Brachionus plicatilis TaxID=10195 RepID=A0A3M7RIP9_BRAPC|nr:hypothetical protein BpHYR1_052875 [Brachionus plicatilis]